MSQHELKNLLDQVADTREFVLRRVGASSATYDAWNDAHDEAEEALRAWRTSGSAEAYAIYRAAQDREDAAQDALAESSRP
jgi:hypothetical protein